MNGKMLSKQVEPPHRSFLRQCSAIEHPSNKCHCLAFTMNAMEQAGDVGYVTAQYKTLIEELERIDTKSDQVELGLTLASILGKRVPRFARKLFEYSKSKRLESPLAEEFFERIYTGCLDLCIKLLTRELLHRATKPSPTDQVIFLINQVPSAAYQCRLFSHLTLQLKQCDRTDDSKRVIRDHLLPSLEKCSNAPSYREALNDSAAALYEHEGELFFDRLRDVPPESRDSTIHSILRYLLSGCHVYEPVDFDKLSANVDLLKAKRACDLLQRISEDSCLVSEMGAFVAAIIVADPHDMRIERCGALIHRDALDIASRLEAISKAKLPDQQNIKHNGYLIVSEMYVARLRDAAHARGTNRQDWNKLLQEIESIPNAADRVFVYAYFSEQTHRIQPELAESALKKAESVIGDIQNPLDRSYRLYSIAKSWKELGKHGAVRDLLRDSVSALGTLPLTKQRDDIVGQILELAHSVDPQFADSLAPTVENPIAEHRARLEWGAKSLQRSPQNIQEDRDVDTESRQEMLSKAALAMTSELNAGRGILPHATIPLKWLRQMVNGKFDDTFNVATWTLHYVLKQRRGSDELGSLFDTLVGTLRLCAEVATIFLGNQSRPPSISNVALPSSLKLFKAGSRQEAKDELDGWLRSKARDYVKIYDPYFTFANLSLLGVIPSDLPVYIVTSWKGQSGVSPGDKKVETLFKDAWRGVSASDPPWTQIVIVGTKSGDSPIHSRFVLTEGAGLTLGTSINSLGAKDTDMNFLDGDESKRIESDFVDPMLGPQLKLFKNEKLVVHTFIL